MNRLDAEIAVITGGTQGLGAAIAHRFAAAGATLWALIDPAEVARAVNFLASDDSGLTGAVIDFDQSVHGGYCFAPPTPGAPLAP